MGTCYISRGHRYFFIFFFNLLAQHDHNAFLLRVVGLDDREPGNASFSTIGLEASQGQRVGNGEEDAVSGTVRSSKGPCNPNSPSHRICDYELELDEKTVLVVRIAPREATHLGDNLVVIEIDGIPVGASWVNGGATLDGLHGTVGQAVLGSDSVNDPSSADLELLHGVLGVNHEARIGVGEVGRILAVVEHGALGTTKVGSLDKNRFVLVHGESASMRWGY